MKFLFASDSFKGALSSEKIIHLLERATVKMFPGCGTVGVPIADGGEGTMDAVITVAHGSYQQITVHGPLVELRGSSYGEFREDMAIIEMTAASGLPMVPQELRDPRKTTTCGTGELLEDALDRGYRRIAVTTGGNATNGEGMGAMRALKIRFLDENDTELEGVDGDLKGVCRINTTGIYPAVGETEFTIMCDVSSPLTGEGGATYTFGKQKGGTPEILDELETGMRNCVEVVLRTTGTDVDNITGAGAAGGSGAALCVFLSATLKSGTGTVLDLMDFDGLLDGMDAVITGEGRVDWQSAFGKVPCDVGIRCESRRIPAVAIIGGMEGGADQIYGHGVNNIMTTINGTMEPDGALEKTEGLYVDTAGRTFRLLKAGMMIAK